ncbi:MAG TPA: iron ABC transporter permease [Ktedonobacteraceae bacterium]
MKLASRPTSLSVPPSRPHRRAGVRSTALVLVVLGCGLLVALLLAVSFGSTAIPLSTVAQILLNATGIFHLPRTWDSASEVIVLDVRLPVVVAAGLVGAALAVAGTLFQGMLRNPLADPYLLGTSSGAAFGATIAFILPLQTSFGASLFSLTPLLAFIGALLTVLLVYALARTDGQTPVVTLLLAGVVVNAVMVALQTLLVTLSPRAQFVISSLFDWLSGGIAIVNWPPVLVVGVIVLVCILCSLALGGVLDAFALGEEGAAYLGLHVEWSKLLIIVLASLLTAAAVSISGLIGFVGLVTPHVLRLWLGPYHRSLIPTSALAGAIFLILADLLARVIIAPAMLPVGVFTALVGAPFFLFLLRHRKRDYRW